ncbi:peptidyl-tRNA hydrolase Pth2 [Halobacteriales archaeon Cl-PHB]
MKQAIVVRKDLGMGQGKMAAQVAHASLSAFQDASPKARKAWQGEGQTKVVLRVDDESSLFALAEKADTKRLPNAIVRDAGRTQLESGTVTALAVGPGEDEVVDSVTGDLSLY